MNVHNGIMSTIYEVERCVVGSLLLMINDGVTSEDWLANLFEENYVLLYRVGRMFLGSSTTQSDIIEDQIQETFALAWERKQKLRQHPNPAGWLVETFRRCLMAQCRKLGREWKRRAFSLDEEEYPNMANRDMPTVEDLLRGKEQLALLGRLLGDAKPVIPPRLCCLLIAAEARHIIASGVRACARIIGYFGASTIAFFIPPAAEHAVVTNHLWQGAGTAILPLHHLRRCRNLRLGIEESRIVCYTDTCDLV